MKDYTFDIKIKSFEMRVTEDSQKKAKEEAIIMLNQLTFEMANVNFESGGITCQMKVGTLIGTEEV